MTKQNEKQQGQKRNPRPLHQTAYASALDSIAKLSSSWLASFTDDNARLQTHKHKHTPRSPYDKGAAACAARHLTQY